jgi:hypothetical protein
LIRFALILLLSIPAMGATLYCSPAGGGSGADFNNLATLPNTTGFVRGNVYKVIEGSYGSKTFSTANSSTTTITIQAVTSADSAVAGYASSLHDTQPTFGSIILGSDYWIIDGVTRNESNWSDGAAYGMRITTIEASTSITAGICAANIVLKYLNLGGPEGSSYTGTEDEFCVKIAGFDELGLNWTMQKLYAHNIAHAAQFHLNGLDGGILEDSWISNGWGKEAVRGQIALKNFVIRRNFFRNASMNSGVPGEGSTAEIAIWDGSANQFDNVEIYRNVFLRTNSEENSGGTIVVGGNGTSWAGSPASNVLIYNNTIAGVEGGASGGNILVNGTGTVRNNLWYDAVGTPSATPNTSNNSEEASDPFVSYAGGNLRLSAEKAGFELGDPYNIDLDGNVDDDGTFSRGAYAFETGGGDVTAPTVSSATIPVGGTTITLAFSEAVSVGAGGNGGFTVSLSGGAATLTYSSGSGSSSLVYTISRTVNQGETGTISYTQPGNGIEDTSGNDLATFSNSAVTNNSSQGSNPTPGVSVGSGVVFSNGVTGVK